jgi:hypothetical protein
MSRRHPLLALTFFAASACASAGKHPASPDGGGAGARALTGVGGSSGTAGAAAGTSGGAGAAAGASGSAGGSSGGAGGEAPTDAGSPDGAAGAPQPAVPDPSTLAKKHLMGYQGWHFAPGDGSPYNQWKHWFAANTPTAAAAHFDLWPDLSELAPAELFATQIDGAGLYSAYTAATVDRHFAWMEAHHLDGVFLQRFANELVGADGRARDAVAAHVKASAEAHGRVFTIMYDISGADEASLVATLEGDWKHLVNDLALTGSGRYQRHAGKPVVAIWGLGFSDRVGTPQQAQQLIAWFKGGADNPAPATVMGGVPTKWRTATDDSKTDAPGCAGACWHEVYRSFDIVSPWAVGRYADDAGADAFAKANIVPDVAEVGAARYMPVIFPGYSFFNASAGAKKLNEIPRRRGAFYWRQVVDALEAGSTMLYTAMFDEVDEGTAMYKVAATAADVPASVRTKMLNLNFDDPTNAKPLPSDWYLELADQASSSLRGEIPLVAAVPTPR